MQTALTLLALPPDAPPTVNVWLLDATRADLLPGALALLSPDEHARHQRYVHDADRLCFALTRAALRQLLAERLGRDAESLSFNYGSHGKPALNDDALQFNVSHSGQFGLIAISTMHRVGVDIERIADQPPLEVLASSIFTQEEREYCATGQAARFYEVWCRKEAMIKAYGAGFAHEGNWPASLPQENGSYAAQRSDLQAWSLSVHPQYFAALAILAGRQNAHL